MSGLLVRMAFPAPGMILATGKRTGSLTGFTLIEVLLVMALVGLVLALTVTLMPSAISGPSSVAFRMDELIRTGMVEALTTRQPHQLEAEEQLLVLRREGQTVASEDLGAEVRLIDPDSGRPLSRVIISGDAMHRPFGVTVGRDEPVVFRAEIEIR